MAIFPRAELEMISFEVQPSEAVTLAGLSKLLRLQGLHRSGALRAMKETHLEQSFNERVFSDVFGYRSIFADAAAADAAFTAFHKLHVAGNQYPDMALGWFSGAQRDAVVSAELKGPGADLDHPQGGTYGGRSAVQQALSAAAAAGAEWCLVSNFDECRLYNTTDPNAYESVRLTDVVSPIAFRRAYALLSRRSLLGATSERGGVLTRARQRLLRGNTMLVPLRPAAARFVMRVRPASLDIEFPFARLNAALRTALDQVPRLCRVDQDRYIPRYEDEVLLVDRVTPPDPVWQRLAVNKAAILSCSVHAPLQPIGDSIFIKSAELALFAADFLALTSHFFRLLTRDNVTMEWALEDLAASAIINDPSEFSTSPVGTRLTCARGIPRTTYPAVTRTVPVSREEAPTLVRDVVAELLFPFEGTSDYGQLHRFEPRDRSIEDFLNTNGATAAFS